MRAEARLAARAHARGPHGPAAFTVLAIATSVALATGLELAGGSAAAELARTADALAGAAELEVGAGAGGVPETLLPLVAATSGVRAAAPLLESTLRLRDGPHAGVALHVLGIDLLADAAVRGATVTAGALGQGDPVRLLAETDAVIVSEGLRARLGLGLGDRLPVRVAAGGVERALVVRGVLAPGGIADAFGGQVVLMDVYALQSLLGLEGRVGRIDVVLEDGADRDAVSASLAHVVEGRATVRPASMRDAWVDHTLATLRLLLGALVALGVVVAGLLSSAAVSLAVDRRLRELALLRLAGLEGWRVRRVVRLEALGLGVAGSAVGLVLGVALARVFLGVLSGLSGYLEGVELRHLDVTPRVLGAGLTIGVGVALAASQAAARRATAAAPLEILARARGGAPGVAPRAGPGLHLLLAAAFGAFGACVLIPAPVDPSWRAGALLASGLAAVGLAARVGLAPTLAVLRPRLEVLLPRIGRLAGASLAARPARTGTALAAVAGVVAGVALTEILVGSLASTLDAWTADQYPGGVLVFAGSPLQGRDREPLAPEVVARIRATPGVQDVFDHATTTVLHRGEEVLLAGSSMAVMARRGRLPALDVDPTDLARALAGGAIAVSDAFATRFGVATGDTLTLDTPAGPRAFRVAGVMRDYAGPSGSLNLDLAVFDALWPRAGSSNLVIWTDAPTEAVLDAVRAAAGPSQPLFFVHGEELAAYASRVLARFTRLLAMAAALTTVLGGIAVLCLLFGAVLERRRELALLRTAGATSGQVAALVLVDGAILGVVGAVGGIGLGLACAWPLVEGVVRTSLAWWITLRVDPLALGRLAAGVCAASLLAACLPAREARRIVPRDVFAPE